MNAQKPQYASLWQRLLAHNIDLVPVIILWYISASFIPSSKWDVLLFGSIYLAYTISFEMSTWKATPGKKWTKLQIVQADQKSPSWSSIILRNVSKLLSVLLLFGGIIMIQFNHKKRALHDYVGGTLVLFVED